ncbi:MAG: beta-ketoacyl-ACP synthase II [Chloroflexi bacterium]|nr:beta-ketoacyl-ACP synthase II [Chloroflexota bacterium]
MYGHRVVVTGLGTLNPIGRSVDEYWRNLLAGTSGIGPITQFDASGLPVRIAAEVKGFRPEDYMDRKAARRMSRFAQLSVAVARQALEDARLVVDEHNAYDVGAIIATGGGGVGECCTETEVLLTRGPDRVNPLFVPAMIANMASCQVSIQFGLKGPVATNIAACAAGIYSFFEALHFLRRGDAQAIVTGGTESAILPLSFISLGRIGALSKRNDEPQKASRPFDKDRDGFVFGEGAGMMVLETLEHARRRGARIYAELVGASITADAYHVSAPEPSGASAARAMSKALADAELQPAEIEYLCAHGTGTLLNDATETRAIKLALGEHAYRVPISSPKSMIGHLLGAAGAMSALTSVLAICHHTIPPTANLDTPDPECNLDYVPWKPREQAVRIAMANGFGFGGQNSVIVFKEFRDS